MPAIAPKRPTVLGIQSPWSGNEHDPIPRTYWLWYTAYLTMRRVKHRIGLHDWQPWPFGTDRQRCTWCGKTRTVGD